MSRDYDVREFSDSYVDPALKLFYASLQFEQNASHQLPADKLKESGIVSSSLQSITSNPGVVILQDGALVGFMVTGAMFQFRGQKAAIIPEYAHGSVSSHKSDIYKLLYMHLAANWIRSGVHIHLIGHFSHDRELKETLYRLRFGAIISEKLRGLTPCNLSENKPVTYEKDPSKLLSIQLEHNEYYQHEPIFIRKENSPDAELAELEEHRSQGDEFIVSYVDDELIGYFIVGESNIGGEGFLLQNTNTAQIKSAYVKEPYRGRSIGSSLLQETIRWAREKGFERLFVEHETANYFGGNFWNKHFSSYLYFSMRYIDNTM